MLLLAEAVPPSVPVPSVPVLSLELAPDICLRTEPDQVKDQDFFKKTAHHHQLSLLISSPAFGLMRCLETGFTDKGNRSTKGWSNLLVSPGCCVIRKRVSEADGQPKPTLQHISDFS